MARELISVQLNMSDGLRQMMAGLVNPPVPEAMEKAAETTRDKIIPKYFRGQGIAKKWPPLSKAYKKWKRKNFPSARFKLKLTGELLRAVRGAEIRKTKRGAILEIDGPAYTSIHHFGGGNIPARPYAGVLTPEDVEEVTEVVREFLLEFYDRRLKKGGKRHNLLKRGINTLIKQRTRK